jgi:hypothetical protein
MLLFLFALTALDRAQTPEPMSWSSGELASGAYAPSALRLHLDTPAGQGWTLSLRDVPRGVEAVIWSEASLPDLSARWSSAQANGAELTLQKTLSGPGRYGEVMASTKAWPASEGRSTLKNGRLSLSVAPEGAGDGEAFIGGVVGAAPSVSVEVDVVLDLSGAFPMEKARLGYAVRDETLLLSQDAQQLMSLPLSGLSIRSAHASPWAGAQELSFVLEGDPESCRAARAVWSAGCESAKAKKKSGCDTIELGLSWSRRYTSRDGHRVVVSTPNVVKDGELDTRACGIVGFFPATETPLPLGFSLD